ncbi:MAG: N-acetyltransferase family protein [Planctomycetota bacterium]
MADFSLRTAIESDIAAISSIYNYYVENSTCTYQMKCETEAERTNWFREHGDQFPVIVAEIADDNDSVSCVDSNSRVLGWASLSAFNRRCAYQNTAEVSVYIHHEHHRRGIGRALLGELVERARALNFHTLIAGVCASQTPSLKLQKSLGFQEVGHLREVGCKFGEWLDVIYLQLML